MMDLNSQKALNEIREAMLTYYDALSARQHGGVAMDTAFTAIQKALGMSWQFGVDHRAAASQEAIRTDFISRLLKSYLCYGTLHISPEYARELYESLTETIVEAKPEGAK